MTNDEKFEQLVSDALKSEREFELPHDFADRVVLKIQQQSVKAETSRDKWWLIVGIVSMIGAFVFAITKVKFTPGVGVYTFFQGYAGLIIFAVIFILILHIVDKTILRKQESG